jgi:hypothetical protein
MGSVENQNMNKLKLNIIKVLHFLSLIGSFIISELYFFSNKSIDFEKYEIYLNNFLLGENTTNLNQGLFYYIANYIMVVFKIEKLSFFNYEIFLNHTIQTTNFLFYLFGIFGISRLLKYYKFDEKSIYISLTILHFIPKIIEMRVTFKPEILAFSFLAWILLLAEKYFHHRQLKYLLIMVFPLSLVLTSKPSIAAMVSLLLIVKFAKSILLPDLRNILIGFVVLLILMSGLVTENFSTNNTIIQDKTIVEGSPYFNKADVNFITNINFWDLYYFPTRDYHNNSAIGITLYDTFGDYYKVSINSDNHYFYYYQSNYSNSDGFNYGIYAREYIAFIFSILFYVLIFYVSFINKKILEYSISPILGIGVLLVSAFGLVGKNYNPLMGDTLKTHYYSFFIALSLVFIFCELYKKNILVYYLVIFAFFTMSIFIIGFPKSDYQRINDNLVDKILISDFCNFTAPFSENVNKEDCGDKIFVYCEYNFYSNEPKRIFSESSPEGYTRIFRSDAPGGELVQNEKIDEFINEAGYSLNPINAQDRKKLITEQNPIYMVTNSRTLKIDSYEKCIESLENGYKPQITINRSFENLPFNNLIIGIFTFIGILFSSSRNRDNK